MDVKMKLVPLFNLSANHAQSSVRSVGDPALSASPIISPSKNSLYPQRSPQVFTHVTAAARIQFLLSPNPGKIKYNYNITQ